MGQTTSKTGIAGILLKQLSHPLKLRIALCVAVIAAWQALLIGPLDEGVATTVTRIGAERKRAETAREIERLKRGLQPYRDRLGAGEDEHELIRHLIARIRSSPLHLVDLAPQKAKSVGPFAAVSLQLRLEGTYHDIDEFLMWVENDKRLLRVDSIQLTPDTREEGRLGATILMVALLDQTAPPAAKGGQATTK
jgi:Tfp pilus assembly protein PilO